MLSKKNLMAIEKLASKDTNMAVDNPDGFADNKGSKKNRIYHAIMAIINKHAGRKLKAYEANGAPLVRNDIYANHDLANDAKNAYDEHQHTLIENNLIKGTKKGRRLARLFFIGNLYGIIKKQKEANANGTHDFELYMQGGAAQADEDRDYIKGAEQQGMNDGNYPNPLRLINHDWSSFETNINYGKRYAKTYATKQGQSDIVNTILDLHKQAVRNLY